MMEFNHYIRLAADIEVRVINVSHFKKIRIK